MHTTANSDWTMEWIVNATCWALCETRCVSFEPQHGLFQPLCIILRLYLIPSGLLCPGDATAVAWFASQGKGTPWRTTELSIGNKSDGLMLLNRDSFNTVHLPLDISFVHVWNETESAPRYAFTNVEYQAAVGAQTYVRGKIKCWKVMVDLP